MTSICGKKQMIQAKTQTDSDVPEDDRGDSPSMVLSGNELTPSCLNFALILLLKMHLKLNLSKVSLYKWENKFGNVVWM